MTPVSPCAPYPSIYSDQPTMPSSVVSLRNELTRQPASQCRSSTLTIFIGTLLDNTIQIIRQAPIIPSCAAPPAIAAALSVGSVSEFFTG
jgi:hypothetical protein